MYQSFKDHWSTLSPKEKAAYLALLAVVVGALTATVASWAFSAYAAYCGTPIGPTSDFVQSILAILGEAARKLACR